MEAVDTTPPSSPLYFPLWIFLGPYLALCDYHSPLTKNDQLLVLFLVHLFLSGKETKAKICYSLLLCLCSESEWEAVVLEVDWGRLEDLSLRLSDSSSQRGFCTFQFCTSGP